MVGDKLLKQMRENRDCEKDLAEAIGLSRKRFAEKVHNRRNASFTQPEIATIIKRYNLTEKEVMDIFFEPNVS